MKTVRGYRITLAFFLGQACLFHNGVLAEHNDSDKPNILFIMADDIAWADTGYNGATFCETPQIDAMAKEGMTFNRFYPGGPNCAPTRACIVTGMYTPRHHLYQPGGVSKGAVKKMRWKVPTRNQGKSYQTFQSNKNTIDGRWISIAEILKPVGYATARIGKWHLGNDEQGFDLSTNDGIHPFSEVQSAFYDDVDVGRQLTDRALQFIEDNRDRPFMIYLNHWDAHSPMRARPELIRPFEKKKSHFTGDSRFDWNPIYAAEVAVVDRSVGRIRAKLREMDIERNTLVIFTSDNGGAAQFTANLPLHGAKGSLFEGGIRTPFVAVWPKKIPPGTHSDVPIAGVDMLPTFAAIAGAALPTNQPVDGQSILPLLQQSPGFADRAIFWHYPLYLAGHTYDRVLPVFGTSENYWRAVPASAIMKGNWKLIHYYEYGTSKLFNLKDDPGEQHDLAQTNSEMASTLRAELMAWINRTNAPVPTEVNPKFSQTGR